ncbi:MAG: hypothetical protein JWP35_3531 [Caulobacter sp.]|nr:hypothetical protein [Caulobacter sp.]
MRDSFVSQPDGSLYRGGLYRPRVEATGSGPGDAATVAFNDTLTMLGVNNVQDAIVLICTALGGAPGPGPTGSALDFTLSSNSGLLGAL